MMRKAVRVVAVEIPHSAVLPVGFLWWRRLPCALPGSRGVGGEVQAELGRDLVRRAVKKRAGDESRGTAQATC